MSVHCGLHKLYKVTARVDNTHSMSSSVRTKKKKKLVSFLYLFCNVCYVKCVFIIYYYYNYIIARLQVAIYIGKW